MNWRIYQCRECGKALAVGTSFPDGGKAKHQGTVKAGKKAGERWVHTESVLYETSEEPPQTGWRAILEWAADQIETGKAKEIPQ